LIRAGVEEVVAHKGNIAENIRVFAKILEGNDVDVSGKRSLMRILQKIPGMLKTLDTYKIPPLGTEAGNDD